MSSELEQGYPTQERSISRDDWQRRLTVSLTILTWVVFSILFFWIVGHISRALILLALGATIATIIHPLATWLGRIFPRFAAVAIIYLIVFFAVGLLLYFVANVIIGQILSLITYIRAIINPDTKNPFQPILNTLNQYGISLRQVQSLAQQIIVQLQGLVNDTIPLVGGIFNFILNIVLISLLSIYFLFSGPRIVYWLQHKTPLRIRETVKFLLDTLELKIGGNFRGTLLLAIVISGLTGIGLYFIGVPYPFLLTCLAFVMEFIPVIGFYITAIAIFLLSLTQGWITSLVALAFVLALQVLEGEILAPRIIGKYLNINPIVAIAALIAGSQLYGILGAFFAGPVAGVLQAIVIAVWEEWKKRHPDQFPEEAGVDQAGMQKGDDEDSSIQ